MVGIMLRGRGSALLCGRGPEHRAAGEVEDHPGQDLAEAALDCSR